MSRQAPSPHVRVTLTAEAEGPSASPQQGQESTPNTWRYGRVVRTVWPGGPGSLRWLRLHGTQLVCVRHREDPAGLRRMVTVELLVGPVQRRTGQRRLQDQAWYPLAVNPADPADAPLLRRLRHLGGRPGRDGLWYLQGNRIRQWGLLDRIAMRPARSNQVR